MATVQTDIIAEGTQIIWVLEQDRFGRPGTAESCQSIFAGRGASVGVCVGDGETMPVAETWTRSPLGINRGFDILVRRSDMRIVWVSTHGTGQQYENLTGEEVLAEVRRIKAGL